MPSFRETIRALTFFVLLGPTLIAPTAVHHDHDEADHGPGHVEHCAQCLVLSQATTTGSVPPVACPNLETTALEIACHARTVFIADADLATHSQRGPPALLPSC